MKFRWLFLAGLLIGCGGSPSQIPPTPSPIPTAIPSPTPIPLESLRANGPHWSQEVLGISSCCGSWDWPWARIDLLNRWAKAGGNLVHIRLGPYWHIAEGSKFEMYESVGGRADLSRFRDSSWQALYLLAGQALDLRLYIEVDLIDGWVMKPANVTLSPWHAQNNVQNEMHVGCGELQGTLDATQEKWVRKIVHTLAGFPNVIWQIGNENGVCVPPVSSVWESDLIWIVRDEEYKYGFMAHLIGTNSELPKIEALPAVDYVMVHQSEAAEVRHGKPTGVNEYPRITPSEYSRQLDAAKSNGTRFDLWLGDSTEEDLAEFLVVLRNHKGTNN